jgi:hypothetical protein
MFEYLNGSDENLRKGAKKTLAYLTGNFARMGCPDPALKLKVPIEAFDAALTAAQDTSTGQEATALKNDTKTTMIDALREYANQNLVYNPKVTHEDKIALGLRIPKTPATINPPNVVPIVVAILLVIRQVTFRYYKQPGDKRMGKPDGAAKFVIYHAILDHEPTSIAELIHKTTVSKGAAVLNFNEEDRGKKLYYVVCWAIERDDLEGPKSEIKFVIIP